MPIVIVKNMKKNKKNRMHKKQEGGIWYTCRGSGGFLDVCEPLNVGQYEYE